MFDVLDKRDARATFPLVSIVPYIKLDKCASTAMLLATIEMRNQNV